MRITTGLREDLRLAAAEIGDDLRVLDLGCGRGELLAHLLTQRGCTGTGVERDHESLIAAITSGVPIIDLDIDTQLGEFADDSYDVVVLSRTLQAMRAPLLVLQQMARIAPKLIVTMPNFAYWRHRLTLLRGRMPKGGDLPFSWYESPNLRFSTLSDLEPLFDEAGLRVAKRLPLDSAGKRHPAGQRGANLLASSAIYVLERQTA